ncbi:erythromycin esterase family protein [Brachybacterium sp.]|uniref:erythromycin esterase family protein n=1 Tax=Brachybacterium sp. TaxID=1891286 RepID=UPI002ED63002
MSASVVGRLLSGLAENAVLGLGEPTHGTAEAFAVKLEVIHELARSGRLAMMAVEESFTVGLGVDAALRGEGDLDAAWDRGSSLWDTVTIREGLRTLRTITETFPRERRPRFLGVDISKPYRTARALQDRGARSPVLDAVASRADLPADAVTELISLCRTFESVEDSVTAGLARNLRRHADAYLLAPHLSRLHRRDTHMADTLLENLPRRGITVLWAHNEHLARNPEGWGDGPTMGHLLDRALGERYVSVGMLCGQGECRAVDPSTGSDDYAAVPLPPLHADTTDHALAQLGTPFVTGEEFTHPGPRRFIGWQVDTSLFDDARDVRDTFEMRRPSTDFWALVHLPRSTADVTAARAEPQ